MELRLPYDIHMMLQSADAKIRKNAEEQIIQLLQMRNVEPIRIVPVSSMNAVSPEVGFPRASSPASSHKDHGLLSASLETNASNQCEGSQNASNHSEGSEINEDSSLPSVWNGRKSLVQRNLDKEANITFLENVKLKWKQLNDNVTTKKEIWKEIANVLSQSYDLGKDGGEKCRLKWRGWWDGYKKYVLECEKTGSGQDVLDNKPPFYEMIHEIVSSSKSAHPDFVSDSFDPTDRSRCSLKRFESKVNIKSTSSSDKVRSNSENVTEVQEPEGNAENLNTSMTELNKSLTEETSVDKLKKKVRSSRHEELMQFMGKQCEQQHQERQEMLKQRKAMQEEREAKKEERHKERVSLTQTLISTMQMMIELRKEEIKKKT